MHTELDNGFVLPLMESFYSIQGESSYNGMPCVFIRLTYCNLRCSYCDTEYSFHEGENMSMQDIIKKVKIVFKLPIKKKY